jgi:hypothetical protein
MPQETFGMTGDVQSVSNQTLPPYRNRSVMTPCGYVHRYQGFDRIYCLHVQCTRRSSMGRIMHERCDCDLIHLKSPSSPLLLPQRRIFPLFFFKLLFVNLLRLSESRIIHSVFCLTKGPKPLPKRFLYIASCFK